MKRGAKKFNKLISDKLCDPLITKEFYHDRTGNYDEIVTVMVDECIWDKTDDIIRDIISKIRTNREYMGIKYHLGASRNFDRLEVTERILEEL